MYGFRSIGNRRRACYLGAGHIIALKAEPSDLLGTHWEARNARDAVAVEILRVERLTHGGRRAYVFHCRTLDGRRELVSRRFYGQNAIPAPVFRVTCDATNYDDERCILWHGHAGGHQVV